MKILIAGYGKMGHMVEEMARQKGWEILAALSSSDAGELQTLEKRMWRWIFPIRPCWNRWRPTSAAQAHRL